MRYGIIGVGAIGGYYGSKLAYSGQEVHFLFSSVEGHRRYLRCRTILMAVFLLTVRYACK